MEVLFPFLTPLTLLLAIGIALCAGFVKGVVGFAQPLVMISGLTLFLSPELALAGLIVPTVVSNVVQAMRQGVRAALRSIVEFRLFLIVGGVALVASAQLIRVIPEAALQFVIGFPAVAYAIVQLSGWQFHLAERCREIDIVVGVVAGALGGLSGVWGPPTVMYLTALNTPKYDQMRVQGVVYGLGAVALLGAHLGSGVLNAATIPFSVMLVLPALIGMWLGQRVIARIDQAMFKRATLVVLFCAGANLIRRAVF